MMPLAITGLGVVSPIGVGREAFCTALKDPYTAKRRAFSQPRSAGWQPCLRCNACR